MSRRERWAPDLLEQVFTALEVRGIRWSVLRGGADLDNAERDVDLLVAADDLAAFQDVVTELGGVPLPRWLQGWHRFFWFRPPTLTRPGLTLDVVTALVYGRGGRLRTQLAAGCLERRSRTGSVYEMAPTDLFWTVMLHCLLDKGDVKERRAQELLAALPHLVRPSPGEAVAAGVCPEGWTPDRLVECVQQGDWTSLRDLASAVVTDSSGSGSGDTPDRRSPPPERGTVSGARNRLPARNSVGGNVAKSAYALVWRNTRRSAPGTREAARMKGNKVGQTQTNVGPGGRQDSSERRRPFRMSLSGLDGSGKSRQTAALAAGLGEEYETELVWVPFDIWPGSMLKLLPTSVRVRLGPRGRMEADAHLTAAQLAEKASEGSGQERSSAWHLKPFWWTVASLAAVSAGTSLRRRVNRMTGEVVVIDRYRLDTIVKLQTWYPTVSPTWLARIVLGLAPAPDVECLLRVEGAVAHARKPEQYNAVQLTRQAQRYDELVASVPGTVAVDGQQMPDDVTRAIRGLADAALHAR